MGNYKIVEANRTAKEYSVFNKKNNFRMTENCKKNLSNEEDHYFGASSEQVNKDLNRNIFLISSEELKIYEEKLARLNGRNYTQGDLYGGSDLNLVNMNLMSKNMANGIEGEISKPISCSFNYLRKDGTLGGINIGLDRATNNVFLAVVNYPDNATSYNDGNVKYVFPENLADEVLNKNAITKSASETEMLTELKETLNHDDISELIETLIKQKELILTAGEQSSNSLLFQRHTKITKINTTDTSQKTQEATFLTIDIESAKQAVIVEKLKEKKELFIRELNGLKDHIDRSNKIENSGMKDQLKTLVINIINNTNTFFTNPNKDLYQNISKDLKTVNISLNSVDQELAERGNIISRFFNSIKDVFSKLFGISQLEKAKNVSVSINQDFSSELQSSLLLKEQFLSFKEKNEDQRKSIEESEKYENPNLGSK